MPLPLSVPATLASLLFLKHETLPSWHLYSGLSLSRKTSLSNLYGSHSQFLQIFAQMLPSQWGILLTVHPSCWPSSGQDSLATEDSPEAVVSCSQQAHLLRVILMWPHLGMAVSAGLVWEGSEQKENKQMVVILDFYINLCNQISY